jgi:cell division protein FtsX
MELDLKFVQFKEAAQPLEIETIHNVNRVGYLDKKEEIASLEEILGGNEESSKCLESDCDFSWVIRKIMRPSY